MTTTERRPPLVKPPVRQQASSPFRHLNPRPWLPGVAVAACVLAGMGAVIRGYQIAQTTLTGEAEFVWFWAGMCLLIIPLVALIARERTAPRLRTALLVLYGLITYAPKLLRDPSSPAYHDEYAHWRAAHNVLSTGKLFQPTPVVPIISRYPGLSAATAALVHATGLTIWQAATLLLIVCHVALVLGIAALAETVGLGRGSWESPARMPMGTRPACLAAVLYGLNSSFLYFDTQYAYESMAITVVVWTLVAYGQAIRSERRPDRAAWGVLTVMLSATAVVTHHLSSFVLVMIMTLVSVTMSVPWLAKVRGWRRTAITAWSLTAAAGGMLCVWWVVVAPATFSYLWPYVSQGLSELLQVATGSGGSRQLFGSSLSPWWEQESAYAVTVLALALAAGGLLLLRSRITDIDLPTGRRRALTAAFVVCGLIYFPSTVFIFSLAGAEGARRSWAFTWIGLSLLMSPAAVWLLDRAKRRTREWSRLSLRSALAAAFAVAMIGGTAAGLDAAYRLPGPFLYGSDARTVTPELLAASRWFSARFGTGNNIITDRYTGLVFASFGLQNTATSSAGFPVYDLYRAQPGVPLGPSYLFHDLRVSDYTYLIVDARMAYELPQLGVYFEGGEPPSLLAPPGHRPVFYGRLAKFNNIYWMTKVFQSDNYSIYRLNLPAEAIAPVSRPLWRLGKLLVP
jgi:hypothetical protein